MIIDFNLHICYIYFEEEKHFLYVNLAKNYSEENLAKNY